MENRPNPIASILLLLVAGWLLFSDGAVSPFVDPAPFVATKLCVLVVEETEDRGSYTPGQREVIASAASVREYVKAKGGEFYALDKDVPLDKAAPWVQEARKVAQTNMLPWIVAATPSGGFTKQLPATAEETLADVQKLGGP